MGEGEKKTIKFKSKKTLNTNTNTDTVTKVNERKKTKTELAFEQHKSTKKIAKCSHKDRINKLNAYLERLPEHNDIPKIGPGYTTACFQLL